MSESNQDQKPQNRFRLAPREQAGPKFPMAGPMDSRDFLPVAQGNVPLEPYSLDVIHFPTTLSWGDLVLDALTTTGFEGLDDLIAEHAPPARELVVAAPAPPRTAFLPVACKPIAPAQAKIIQGYPPLPPIASAAAGEPAFDVKPLRPRMTFGPNPNAPKPVVPATPVAQKTVVNTPARTVSTPPVSQSVKPVVRPAPVVQVAATKPVPAAALTPAAPPAPRLVPQPSVTVKPPAPPSVTVRPPVISPQQPSQRPAAAASAAPAAPVIESAPAPERPKIGVRPANTPSVAPAPPSQIDREKRPSPRPAPSTPSRPAMAARDGNALTAERLEPESMPAPQLKPKLMPIRKPEPAYSTSVAVEEYPTFGMHQMEPSAIGKFWSNAGGAVKGLVIVAAVAIVGAVGYVAFKPAAGSETAYIPGPTAITEGSVPGMGIGGGGWTTNWGADAPINKGRQISLFRPSMSMTDYRFEFRGQIEKKAVGWIFRASNSKNYYAAKIEVIKPGLNPIVAMIKYSVLKGVEGTHTQVMLPNDFKMDTQYRVRMDVKGNKFTTYVQDKLVDYWTDDQIKTGGAGFLTDRGERAQIRSSQIAYISASK